MRPRSHVNTGVECVWAGDRAFSLRPILSEFAVGYFIPAWEEEARELQSSVKLNGGNKFWAISGQWALPGNPAHLGNIHICQQSSRDICQRWSQFAEGIANIQHFDFHGCAQGEGGPGLNLSNCCCAVLKPVKTKIILGAREITWDLKGQRNPFIELHPCKGAHCSKHPSGFRMMSSPRSSLAATNTRNQLHLLHVLLHSAHP